MAASASFGLVRRGQRAEITAEQELPSDVAAEVHGTWERFTEVFAAHRRCFDDVSLRLVWELEEGDARYVIDDARIEVLIPTSPRRFRESLVHELAHHLEHTCGRFGRLQADFAALPGVGDEREGRSGWNEGERWQAIPAELWAETVVAVVNGERVRHPQTMPLPPGAERLVESWARGDGVG